MTVSAVKLGESCTPLCLCFAFIRQSSTKFNCSFNINYLVQQRPSHAETSPLTFWLFFPSCNVFK